MFVQTIATVLVSLKCSIRFTLHIRDLKVLAQTEAVQFGLLGLLSEVVDELLETVRPDDNPRSEQLLNILLSDMFSDARLEERGSRTYVGEGRGAMVFSTAESQAVLESCRMIAVAVCVTYGWITAF